MLLRKVGLIGDDAQPVGYSSLAARKQAGAHYTPDKLAQFVAERIVEVWPSSKADGMTRVLDPAVGDGSLLLAILRELIGHGMPAIEVSGYDTDPSAIDSARIRIAGQFPDVSLHLAVGSFIHVCASYAQPDLFSLVSNEPYDLVIANPPYVRTQVMGSRSAQDLASQFGLSGRVDLYYAFLEGIARVLRPGGIAGIIVSNRFMTTKAGADVRIGISRQFDILHVWDLGDTHLFEAAVLPAVLLVRRKSGANEEKARFTSIYSVKSETWDDCRRDVIEALSYSGTVRIDNGEVYQVLQGTLDRGKDSGEVWRLANSASEEWLSVVRAHTDRTFKEVGEIRVGVKTTADKVFVRSDWSEMPADQRPELLRPLTTHRIARRFRPVVLPRATEILYTHTVVDGKRVAIRLEDFPRSARYLNDYRAELEAREYVKAAGRNWYEVWVPQDPTVWGQPKVVFRDIVDKPTFWMDLSGSVVNGDCYWLTCRTPGQSDWLWLALAVGNSSFIETFYDRRFNNKLYAGRRRFMTQYVEHFPLPALHTDTARTIIRLAKDIYETLARRAATEMERQLDRLVWQAFGVG